MSVLKGSEYEIRKFEFGKLVPDSGKSAQEAGEVGKFDFKPLKDAERLKNHLTDEVIRQERANEANSAFEISPYVKEHRGLNRQAEEDYELAVAQEVEKRLAEISQQAYQEGLDRGLQEGQEKAYSEARVHAEQQIEALSQELARLQEDMSNVLNKSKDDAYMMVKNLSKWVILKEVDEKYYLARLLEKLIHEINSKSNLVLHVNQSAFGYMPEIVKIVERKVGQLTNTRIEVDLEMTDNGIKIESDNIIIDGSLDAQFETIDRLFLNVGVG